MIEINDGKYMVYHEAKFATVVNGKCDCSGHRGPCVFAGILSKLNTGSSETYPVVKKRQTTLSTTPIPFTMAK